MDKMEEYLYILRVRAVMENVDLGDLQKWNYTN